MIKIQIKPFDYKYIEEIIPLLSANTPYVYPHHRYTYWILGEYFPSLCYVAIKGDDIKGFVCALHSIEKDSIFIWQLVVADNSRGKGVANLLCSKIEAYARKNKVQSIQLTISNENTASIAFFMAFAHRKGKVLEKIDLPAIDNFDGETAYEISLTD